MRAPPQVGTREQSVCAGLREAPVYRRLEYGLSDARQTLLRARLLRRRRAIFSPGARGCLSLFVCSQARARSPLTASPNAPSGAGQARQVPGAARSLLRRRDHARARARPQAEHHLPRSQARERAARRRGHPPDRFWTDKRASTITFRGRTVLRHPEYLAPRSSTARATAARSTGGSRRAAVRDADRAPPFYCEMRSSSRRSDPPIELPAIPLGEREGHFAWPPDSRPEARLGSAPDDADPIKRHPFFSEIDWLRIAARSCRLRGNPMLSAASTRAV